MQLRGCNKGGINLDDTPSDLHVTLDLRDPLEALERSFEDSWSSLGTLERFPLASGRSLRASWMSHRASEVTGSLRVVIGCLKKFKLGSREVTRGPRQITWSLRERDSNT